MNTLGLTFILAGILAMRQVVVGRVKETGPDLKAMFTSIVSGDFSGVADTLALRGENVSPDAPELVAPGASGLTTLLAPANGELLNECITLGNKAVGYKLGGVGPSYYDCSGLIWQAMVHLGEFNGPRFTTGNFVKALGSRISAVATGVESTGDVVLWPGKHMGVVSGPDKMFSAMSPAHGIGFASISGSDKSPGGETGGLLGTHVFYRVSPGHQVTPGTGGVAGNGDIPGLDSLMSNG